MIAVKSRKYVYNSLIIGFFIYIILGLFACSSKTDNSSSHSTGDVNQLSIVAPSVVLSSASNQVNNAYVVIENAESIQVTGVNYSISSIVGSGNQITINSASSNKCSTISANNFCILSLNIPGQLPAGSFTLHLSNTNSSLLESSLSIIGVQAVVSNTLSNADGITLYYNPIVLANTPYMIVSGAVTSPNAGGFNVVSLTDSRGNVLPNQTSISANMGAGFPNLTSGDVFEILLPVPSTNNGNQILQIQTSEIGSNGIESIVSQSTTSNMLNTVESGGILTTLPSAVSLDYTNPSQSLTIYNSGNQVLTINTINSTSNNVTVTSSSKTILPGATTVINLTMLSSNVTATTSYLTLSGVSNQTTFNNVVTVYQNISSVAPRPLPSPVPTTTPTIAPTINPTPIVSPTPLPTQTPVPPVPVSGLAVNMSSTSFITNTQVGRVSQFITLINTGNTPESNFVFDFGANANFTLSVAPLLSNACQISGNTITSILNPTGNNSSCVAILTWMPGATPLPPTIAMYQINYNYGYVLNSSSIQVLVTANYLATANLILTPSVGYFASIINNGESFSTNNFTLSNTGDGVATSISSSITPINNFPSIFTFESNVLNICGSSLLPGETCSYLVQFGPLLNAGGQTYSLNTLLNINYIAYSGGISESAYAKVIGTIYESSNIITSISGTQGFLGGSGTINSPFLAPVTQYTNYILTFQLKNDSDTALEEFYVDVNNNYMGNWKMNSSYTTCPINMPRGKFSLAKNATCNVAVQATFTNSLGLISMNPQAFTVNWGLNSESSQITAPLVYVDVYQSVGSSLSQPVYGQKALITTPITVQFTAPVKNVTTNTVNVYPYNNMVPIAMTLVSNTESSYTFQPSVALLPGTPYLVRTLTGITDQNGNNVAENTMEFNTANDVINWTQVNTPTAALIATVAPDGTLFYSDTNGDVYMQQTNGSFTNIAHFHKTDSNPGITTFNVGYFPNQTPSPYTLFVGTGTNDSEDDNKMYMYIVGDGSNVQTLADFNFTGAIKDPDPGPPPGAANWPTASVFNAPSNNLAGGYIYYANAYGDFFYNYAGFPPNPFADMTNSYYVYSIVMANNPLDSNNLYFYAISTYQTIFTDDYPNLRQLWACQPFAQGQCTVIDGYNGAGMLTTDNNNNIYAGWYDGSVYKYSLSTLESTAFVVGSNTSASVDNVNTQVAWDNGHNQLLVYNFYPTGAITAYDFNGNTLPFVINSLPSNGVGVQQVFPGNYNYRNTVTIIPNGNGPVGSNNTIYFLTESGVLYYVAY